MQKVSSELEIQRKSNPSRVRRHAGSVKPHSDDEGRRPILDMVSEAPAQPMIMTAIERRQSALKLAARLRSSIDMKKAAEKGAG